MRKLRTIKKINIIITLIFAISIIFSNCSLAVGNAFSDAEGFLGKRGSYIKCNRRRTIKTNIKLYV